MTETTGATETQNTTTTPWAGSGTLQGRSISPEFGTWPIDEMTQTQVNDLRWQFDALLNWVASRVPAGNERYLALVKTKMEEACMFAVKAITKPTINS